MTKTTNGFDLTAISGNLTFSKDSVWLWVKLEPVGFEFITDSEKISYAYQMEAALTNLMPANEDTGIEAHIIVTNQVIDAYSWITALKEKSDNHAPRPAYTPYLQGMYNHVHNQNFREKLVLLGVKIGERRNYSATRSMTPGVFEKFVNLLAAAPVSDYVSPDEAKHWKKIGMKFEQALVQGGINAIPAAASEIAYAAKKTLYPSMPPPSIEDLSIGNHIEWGDGEVAELLDGQVENGPRALKITQLIDGKERVGYRATLCFSKFPETMYYPRTMPWIHLASLMDFPVDFSLRFTLEPVRKVRKEVDRKLKEAQDQAQNMTSGGGSTNREIEEQIARGFDLEHSLKKANTPWVFGRYRIIIEGKDMEELNSRAQQVIEQYRAQDIMVTWSSGDQLSLLKEAIPNDRVRVPAYYQRQELGVLSTGIPSGTGTAGDVVKYIQGSPRGWIGPYLGYTIGTTHEPVFSSIHSVIDTSDPGGCSISGRPGQGKTFLGLTLTHQMALAGTWTVYIDPKADALDLQTLPGMQEITRVVNLREGNDGLLDPFSIGTDLGSQQALAMETLTLLLGGNSSLSSDNKVALSQAVESVANTLNPSLGGVVHYLERSETGGAPEMAARLRNLMKQQYARLCFASGSGEQLRVDQGLTIITILGLDLPPAGLEQEKYTLGNHLAVGIMYLLTTYTRDLMLNAAKSQPKAIVIDEAWAVVSTTQGAKLAQEVARMGRAHNTALVLISQNVGDMGEKGIKNSISQKFCFSATGEEAEEVLRYLDMEVSTENLDLVRQMLGNGQCLMKDASGRIAVVQIDSWDAARAQAFDTNPTTRGKR